MSLGIADKAVVWVAPCPKRFILKGPRCIESSFLRVGAGPGSGGSKRLNFLKGGLVQNRHFWTLVRVRALGRSKTAPL